MSYNVQPDKTCVGMINQCNCSVYDTKGDLLYNLKELQHDLMKHATKTTVLLNIDIQKRQLHRKVFGKAVLLKDRGLHKLYFWHLHATNCNVHL